MSTQLHCRRGVATVIGMAIALGILFSIIIPLLLYYQSATALYNQAVSERRNIEYERIQERLFLVVTRSSSGTIVVETTNMGVRPVVVSAILVLDGAQGDAAIATFRYPYGVEPIKSYESRRVDTGVPHTISRYVKVVTRLGNVFSARPTVVSEGPAVIAKPPVQLSLSGVGGPWTPLSTTWENLKNALRADTAYIRVNLVNMRYTEISLTSASQVIFILAQTDIPQNVMIIGRLVGNLIIPPQQNVTALFKLLEPDPQIIKAIDQRIDPSSYPLTAAGLLTLVMGPSGNSFVSLTITIDPLLLTAKK